MKTNHFLFYTFFAALVLCGCQESTEFKPNIENELDVVIEDQSPDLLATISHWEHSKLKYELVDSEIRKYFKTGNSSSFSRIEGAEFSIDEDHVQHIEFEDY